MHPAWFHAQANSSWHSCIVDFASLNLHEFSTKDPDDTWAESRQSRRSCPAKGLDGWTLGSKALTAKAHLPQRSVRGPIENEELMDRKTICSGIMSKECSVCIC